MFYFWIILVALVATGVFMLLYQLLIQKYYWGPNGPPKKDEPKKRGR